MAKLLKVFRILIIAVLLTTSASLIIYFSVFHNSPAKTQTRPGVLNTVPDTVREPFLAIGPRENIPADAPTDYDSSKYVGFWSFAIPVSGILSRSGQPTYEDFKWLKHNGWKSVVDLRMDGEYMEVSEDSKIAGFNELGFHYLHLPIVDGGVPSDEQAGQFLDFVTDKNNQPVHIHCRAGIGRTGTLTALYRYSVQGWPLDEAIEKESRLYSGGINSLQKLWLENWARHHQPGSYNK